jgi:hypothetical protein
MIAVQHLRALVVDVADPRMSVEYQHESGIERFEKVSWWPFHLFSVKPLIVV